MATFSKIVTFFGALLCLSSAYAEDIYDRINECDKRSDRDCMMALIRELAQKVERPGASAEVKYDKSTDANQNIPCQVVEVPGLGRYHMQIRVGAGVIYDADFKFDMQNAEYLSKLWKNYQCADSAKIDCTLYSDGSFNMFGANWAASGGDKLFSELQRSVCR
jgi:hypothetical protein